MTVSLNSDDVENPIAILITCSSWERALQDAAGETRRAVAATLNAVGVADAVAEVSVLLTDDEEIQTLNRDWREQDKPTNVLSFPAMEVQAGTLPVAEFTGQSLALGDVALAYQTVALEAGTLGIPFGNHFDHLVVHGVLHLLGYDHQSGAEAELMEDLERQVLAGLGIPDPYKLDPSKTLDASPEEHRP